MLVLGSRLTFVEDSREDGHTDKCENDSEGDGSPVAVAGLGLGDSVPGARRGRAQTLGLTAREETDSGTRQSTAGLGGDL